MKKKLLTMAIGFTFLLGTGCQQQAASDKEKSKSRPVAKTEQPTNPATQEPPKEKPLTYKKAQQPAIQLPSLIPAIETFAPQTSTNQNKAAYELNVELDDSKTFQVRSAITVNNLSSDLLNELAFYFIPNAFTKENKPEWITSASTVSIKRVAINGEYTPFDLKNDIMLLKPVNGMDADAEAKVEIEYSMTIPENGARLSELNGNYYLVQWYPMLAEYKNGWEKEDFSLTGESYHTDYSDFTVHCQVPQGYSVFSSAEQDAKEGTNKGTVSMKHIKEFYIAIVKDMMVKSIVADGVSIRVIGNQSDAKKIEETLEVKKVLSYFKQKFGPYPFKQLDIVINGGGMEYPGIVEVNTTPEEPAINETVVHEAAHQWFYHGVSNDPYYHAWIDEGLTSLATMLYFINVEKTPVDTIMEQPRITLDQAIDKQALVPAGSPLSKYEKNYYASVYCLIPIKVWELSNSDPKQAEAFLHSFYQMYQGKEVDTNESIRFMASYFKQKDAALFKDWVAAE